MKTMHNKNNEQINELRYQHQKEMNTVKNECKDDANQQVEDLNTNLVKRVTDMFENNTFKDINHIKGK